MEEAPAEGVIQAIREVGFAQGDLIGPEQAERLCGMAIDHIPREHCGVFLVILTQDCDLVRDVQQEPYVELLALKRLEEPPESPRRGNSARSLDLIGDPCGGLGDRSCWFRASIHDRFRVPKESFSGVCRCSEYQLADTERHLLRTWIGRRYKRDAFPDRFEANLAATSGRVKRLFKSKGAKLISSIFLRIHNPEVLEGDFRLSVILSVRDAILSDDRLRSEVDSFEQQLINAFRSRPGIVFDGDETDCPDVRVMSEEDLTVAILRVYKRYDVDFRSLDDDAEGPAVHVDDVNVVGISR